MSPPLHRDWTNSHLFSSSIPNGHSTLALGDANGYAEIPQALHEMCVSWTSLFIDLYSRCLKIILTLVTLVTLVPCFYLVSRTAPISAHWQELGVLAWLSSHPPRRPCRLICPITAGGIFHNFWQQQMTLTIIGS